MTTALRILLVEDDPDQARLFSKVLKAAGYDIVTVTTAEAAREALEADGFALLLTDWDLPAIQGDTLIQQAQAMAPEMPTVLFSNHANVDEAATAVHASAWFRKIEGIVRLRQIIQTLLPQRSNHAA